MDNPILGITAVVGRVFLCLIFLMSALANKIPNFSATTESMAEEGIPAAPLMLVGAIVFLISGTVSVILGYKARIGAALLLVFLILATYFFHDFWTMEGSEAQSQQTQFMKNLGLMGAMLFIIANGAGAMSLDRKVGGRKAESEAS